MKCSFNVILINVHTGSGSVCVCGGGVPKGTRSYTVLCLLSRLYPIASEE